MRVRSALRSDARARFRPFVILLPFRPFAFMSLAFFTLHLATFGVFTLVPFFTRFLAPTFVLVVFHFAMFLAGAFVPFFFVTMAAMVRWARAGGGAWAGPSGIRLLRNR